MTSYPVTAAEEKTKEKRVIVSEETDSSLKGMESSDPSSFYGATVI